MASSSTPTTSLTGWYGKLPGLGDFVQGRLPADFVARWDTWLQEGITDSKAVLRETWLDSYLTAHIWHFVLMPGVLNGQCWAGVWMPSVNKVGRYFPFTAGRALATRYHARSHGACTGFVACTTRRLRASMPGTRP